MKRRVTITGILLYVTIVLALGTYAFARVRRRHEARIARREIGTPEAIAKVREAARSYSTVGVSTSTWLRYGLIVQWDGWKYEVSSSTPGSKQ